MATTAQPGATPVPPVEPSAPEAAPVRQRAVAAGTKPSRTGSVIRGVVLTLGAVAFLFPFYYMVIGSLQETRDSSLSGLLPFGNVTLDNYTEANERIDLVGSLVNSGIFTMGVILGTVVFGLLAGYALAMLHFRGRSAVFGLVLLVQVVPFQLLIIPLYVMVVRNYGLADSYAGMILPFAINSTAVFIFRQFFLQLPDELFQAARIDGAGEFRVLWSIALPLVRPALLTAVLLTFIGPWNEFLWPFLVTKEASMQPLAVSLANYISNVAASATNPSGAILAGACVLAAPAIALFIAFQRYFVTTDIGSGVKG